MPESPFARLLERVEHISRFHYIALRAIDMRITNMPGWGAVSLNKTSKRITIELTPKLMGMALDDQAFTVMHETEHILRGHLSKPTERDPLLWNIAGDCLINTDLANEYSRNLSYTKDFYKQLYSKEVLKVPDNCNTIELVYDYLLKNNPELKSKPKNGGGKGSPNGSKGQKGEGKNGEGGSGGENDGDAQGDGQADNESRPPGNDLVYPEECDGDEINDAVRDIAKRIHAGRGFEHAPMRFRELLTKKHEKKVDWRKLMQNAFHRVKPELTVTYSKINARKYSSMGIVSPGRKMRGLPNVYVMIDTSGSCMAAAPFFLEELNNILEETGLEVEGCFLDTSMHPFGKVSEVTQELRSNVIGGEGTDFTSAYTYLLEQDVPYDLVIMMTDCYVDGPKTPIANRTIVFTIGAEDFMNGSCPNCEMYKVEIKAEEL